MKNKTNSYLINIGLLLSGFSMMISGLLIQINFHMGNRGEIAVDDSVLGISYYGWSDIHKVSIVVFSILMIFHIVLHWKWYKTVIRKKLISKNFQQIALSVFFILVAFTGYIPWFIKLMNGSEMLRKVFIEFHDKLAIVLFIYLILHIIKKLKWIFLRV